MLKKKKSLLGVALLLLSPFYLTGSVAHAGDPVPGLDITIEQIPGGETYQATTDARGEAVFPNVASGTYQVIFASKIWTDHNAHDPGVSFSVSGGVTVRGWDAKQKRAATALNCSPNVIKEEGVKRESDVAIKEKRLKRSRESGVEKMEKGPSSSSRSSQNLGVVSVSKFKAGPVCGTILILSVGGKIIIAAEEK